MFATTNNLLQFLLEVNKLGDLLTGNWIYLLVFMAGS